MNQKIDPKLEAIGIKIANKLNVVQKDKYGSVILILMIISIVISLIRVIQECHKNKLVNFGSKEKAELLCGEIQNICIKKSLFNKIKLKKILKEKLSPEDYKTYGYQLRDAILDSGAELTEEESFTLVEAANV